MTRKTDRRSLRTQSAIKKALEELLAEKNISEISITELTERADIHRATFYLHYEDIYDLYQDYKMDIFKNLTSIFEDDRLDTYQSFYDALLDYIADNSALVSNLFQHSISTCDSTLTENIMHYMIDMCKSAWMSEWNITEISPELEYFAYYRVHGITALIVHWIRSDYSISLEDLKKLITDLDSEVDQFMRNRK